MSGAMSPFLHILSWFTKGSTSTLRSHTLDFNFFRYAIRHGNKTSRSKSVVKQKGMVFGFRKTVTAVVGPEIDRYAIPVVCIYIYIYILKEFF
jgi:hypothetical protein